MDRAAFLARLRPADKERLHYEWAFRARPEQLPPPEPWLVWDIEAGRGFGKTRTGAETIKAWALARPGERFALVAETFADGRDVMVEGESGLLSILPPSTLRGGRVDTAWNRSMGELYLANGSRFDVYSSEKPGGLRGPQHHGAWADEIAKWRDARLGTADDTTWSNLMMGLRLGQNPQCVVTTTPKPVKLLKGDGGRAGIRKQAGTIVTKGTTFDNLPNLSPAFRQQILNLYEGTRLGRQELYAEDIEDVDGALWTSELIESTRIGVAPTLQRVVTGIDPAVSAGENSDETGIVTAGIAMCGCKGKPELHGFILEDSSGRYSPDTWARKAIGAHERHHGDRLVAEVNNGGDLVEANLRTIDRNIPLRKVHAAKGKLTRAEPIAALFEQGKIHHVGVFPHLEDQMCSWTPGEKSPDRMDALVWALTELMLTQAPEPAMDLDFGAGQSTWAGLM